MDDVQARPAPVSRRDDVDRLLIVGGLVGLAIVLWPLALAAGALAAWALWLHRPWTRVPLIGTGIATVVVAPAAVLSGPDGSPALAALGGLAGAAIALGASRLRFGPFEARDRSAAVPVVEAPDDGSPPARWTDLADDPALIRFLDEAAHLDRERLRTADAAWRAVRPAERDRAWAAVRRAAAATGREDVLEQVRREIEQWGRAAGGSPWTWEFGTMTDVDRGNLRRAAMPALLDAAAAIVVRDRLGPDDRLVLGGPWEATLGEPADGVADEGSRPTPA